MEKPRPSKSESAVQRAMAKKRTPPSGVDAAHKPLPPARAPMERPGPEGGTRDSNRRERIRRLEDAAIELFLEEGIERVTIDQIAERAEMAKGGFYRYFRDKEDLVAALLLPLSTALREATDACETELASAQTSEALYASYERLAAQLALAFLAHQPTVRLYLQECRAPGVGPRRPVRELADELARRAVALTLAAHTHGLLRPLPPRVTALVVVGAAERLVYGLLTGEDIGDPFVMTQTLVALVLDGMRAPGR